MKKFITILAALAALSIACTKEPSLEIQQEDSLEAKLIGGTDGEIVPGSVLVKLSNEAVAKIESGELNEVSKSILGEIKASLTPALPIRPKNIEVAKKYGLLQWYKVDFDEEMKAQDVASHLASSPAVTCVQFNRIVTPIESEEAIPAEEILSTKSQACGMFFDDPYSVHQWNLHNDGSIAEGAIEGADVGVKDAWRLTGGSPNVVVAVFDCGLYTRHEDLKDALWTNDAELNGSSGVDDDGNGYIDDKYGYNFVKNNSSIVPGDYGHGTHVGGIIGAVNGNGVGISSIAGGSGNGDGVRLMSVQIFDSGGNLGSTASSDTQIAAAYTYAADNGACIAQCSYASPYQILYDDIYVNGNGDDIKGSPLENAALKYFLDPANSNHASLKGNIAVFSAGNFAEPYSRYPGALPYVISVSAFGYDFLPGGYTNYGAGCKISAPGGEPKEGIRNLADNVSYKYLPTACILSTGVTNAANMYQGVEREDGKESKKYVYMWGTSMACPHVSGVLALGISYAEKLGKKFSREEMTSMLFTSVNDLDQYYESGSKNYYDLSTGGKSTISLNQYYNKMGTGAVDAWKFLMAIEGTPSVIVSSRGKSSIDLTDFCNPGDSYEISIDEASKASLGLASDPIISNGSLIIECSKVGAGKIVLTSSVGKDSSSENGIGSMDYSRTISIVSRQFAAKNGGWL